MNPRLPVSSVTESVDDESPYHSLARVHLEFKQMSQTWKDSGRLSMNRLILKVAMNDDGTYQINLNEEVVGNRIPEKWLDDELCGKRGFCGEELAEIKRQLRDGGTAIFTV
jgi:hypothetical protein